MQAIKSPLHLKRIDNARWQGIAAALGKRAGS
jgi:hypothetical protein